MHNTLGLLYLNERRGLHFSLQIHKVVFNTVDVALKQFFVPVVPVGNRMTRGAHINNMKVPMCRSDLGRKAIRYRGPTAWNRLPNVAKGIDMFVEFKRWVSARIHNLFGDHPV